MKKSLLAQAIFLSIYSQSVFSAQGDTVSASVVTPTVQGMGNLKVISTEVGGTPLTAAEKSILELSKPNSINFTEIFDRLKELNKCHDDTEAINSANENEFTSYSLSSENNKILKSHVNYFITGGKVGAAGGAGYAPSCNLLANTPSKYYLAAMIRENVKDFRTESDDIYDFYANFHLNVDVNDSKSFPSCYTNSDNGYIKNICDIKTMFPNKEASSKKMRQFVIKYLNDNQIEHAWVDIEFEIKSNSSPGIKVETPVPGCQATNIDFQDDGSFTCTASMPARANGERFTWTNTTGGILQAECRGGTWYPYSSSCPAPPPPPPIVNTCASETFRISQEWDAALAVCMSKVDEGVIGDTKVAYGIPAFENQQAMAMNRNTYLCTASGWVLQSSVGGMGCAFIN